MNILFQEYLAITYPLLKGFSFIILAALVATRFQPLFDVLFRRHSWNNPKIILQVVFFISLTISGNYFSYTQDFLINFRVICVVIAGIVGGPIVGTVTGLAGGGYRFFLGGATALPCSLATFVSGCIAGYFSTVIKNEKNRNSKACALTFLLEIAHGILVILLTPSWAVARSFIFGGYFSMLIFNPLGVSIFLKMVWDTEKHFDNILRINKLINEIEKNYLETITTLAAAIDARDSYTAYHSKNVAYYSYIIGKELKLTDKMLSKLILAALLHDIGKIGIKDNILLKEKGLSDEEYEIMKSHPEKGYEILSKGNALLNEILPLVLNHHERFDGKGYPNGLKEPDLETSIISVADAFDAMTSNRPYRKALSLPETVKELKDNEGTQFHPLVSKKLQHILISGKLGDCNNDYNSVEKIISKFILTLNK